MHTVIIGNGVSGISAARWLRKLSDNKITVISDETDHFFSRTALMYIYMGHMRFEDTKPYEDWFWKKNRIELLRDRVTNLDFTTKKIILRDNSSLEYDHLLLALGSTPNKFGWPGQDLNRVSGLYHYQDLEKMEKHSDDTKRAVIVGGGLIGIEMAEMFKSRGKEVSMLVREPSYWSNILPPEESAMVTRHIKDHHIDLQLGVNLEEIVDDGNGNASAVKVKETGKTIKAEYVGLTAGVSPNVTFLKGTSLEINRGILVDNHLQTNQKDVYAIGDCAELREPMPGRRPIEAIWYTGRMMGEVAAYNICDKPQAYDPGIWFNSAKFLDIEYQVYGEVPAQMPEYMASLYWEHADGTKAVRINYDKESLTILGFNLMGIRYRHEVCEKWLAENTHIETVLQNLGMANFDPEFYKQYEADVVALYNKQTGKNLSLKTKRGLRSVLSFLTKKA